jgi:hypothetical protein
MGRTKDLSNLIGGDLKFVHLAFIEANLQRSLTLNMSIW